MEADCEARVTDAASGRFVVEDTVDTRQVGDREYHSN